MIKHKLIKQQLHYADDYIKKIKQDQNQGIYPKNFSLPLGLQLELTSNCNLFCKHCYNSSGKAKSTDRMKISDWVNLTNDIVQAGGIFQCIISGGEPLLLGDNLHEIMEPLHEDGTGFVLITNGMLVDQVTVKRLKKYNFYWVQVSIDNVVEEKHDEFRRKKGSWAKAIEAAFLFSGAGLPLRIAHSITPANIQDLPEMLDLAYKLGASSVVCGSIMPSGRAFVDDSLYSHNESFLEKMYSMIDKCQRNYRGVMEVLISSDLPLDAKRKKDTPNTAVVIRPNGDVRMDCTMPFVIGNVLKEPFKNIWMRSGNNCWNHPLVRKYISEINEYGVHPQHKNHVDVDIILT